MPLLAVDPDGEALVPLEKAPVIRRGTHGGRSVFVAATDESEEDGEPEGAPAEAPPAGGADAAELARVAAELAQQRGGDDSDSATAHAPPEQAALDAFVRDCVADAEVAQLEGAPLATQLRLLHGASYGTVRMDGAFDSSAALASALAFVRSMPTYGQAEAACVFVPRACVQYPHVWYAGSWPEQLRVDAPGAFVELHTRSGAEASTWFLPEVGGVLGEPVRLPPDCALVEGGLFA